MLGNTKREAEAEDVGTASRTYIYEYSNIPMLMPYINIYFLPRP